ncbi:hypothetical protein Nepgr_025108 [Nepenthes gracilis]|uniref:Uncharacterized protein n=1 Tax=Nepenthes gracilis TaxID=150966 RepID=A0AAD3Y0R6_NEPGR|nr:hypothetical protein Nepgr_025108 [Nepenthes gracilis]
MNGGIKFLLGDECLLDNDKGPLLWKKGAFLKALGTLVDLSGCIIFYIDVSFGTCGGSKLEEVAMRCACNHCFSSWPVILFENATRILCNN